MHHEIVFSAPPVRSRARRDAVHRASAATRRVGSEKRPFGRPGTPRGRLMTHLILIVGSRGSTRANKGRLARDGAIQDGKIDWKGTGGSENVNLGGCGHI